MSIETILCFICIINLCENKTVDYLNHNFCLIIFCTLSDSHLNLTMNLFYFSLHFILLLIFVELQNVAISESIKNRPFLNVWAVKINGGINAARQVAHQYGYELIDQVR